MNAIEARQKTDEKRVKLLSSSLSKCKNLINKQIAVAINNGRYDARVKLNIIDGYDHQTIISILSILDTTYKSLGYNISISERANYLTSYNISWEEK